MMLRMLRGVVRGIVESGPGREGARGLAMCEVVNTSAVLVLLLKYTVLGR
jgi:hypothetical protein